MSQADHQPEDVASLFKKFGGDAHDYREFAQPEPTAPAGASWALVPGRTGAAPASAAPAPPASGPDLAATTPPRPAPPPSAVSALWPAPAPAPVSAPAPALPLRVEVATAPGAAGPRSLDVLFARWAGTPPPPSPPASGHGLLSRWRSKG